MVRRLVVPALALALAACGSSDLDDLCRRAEALEQDASVPVGDRPVLLFAGWEPGSRGGRSIKEAMSKEGEIRSAASFRKIIESRTSKAWSCPQVEAVLTAPATVDAASLCEAAAGLDGTKVPPNALGAALARRWTPVSAWGRAVAEGLGAKPVDEVPALLARSYQDETGLVWECEALAAAVTASRRAEVVTLCDLARSVETGPMGSKPVHLRRAKMAQLAGGEIGGDLESLRARFTAVGEPPCPPLERVLGLVPEGPLAPEADAAGTTGG
ncbi:MAG TPA: hypothetical protein PKW35_00485 [Nannocystaceae bacterium]|nr:hypothetical protein [Nannocystaceae bacterium]